MWFDDELEMYSIEIDGIIFVCEDEFSEDDETTRLKAIAEKYWENLDSIIEFMLPDLQELYGDLNAEFVKDNLGKPTIDFENGQVNYCEQKFDDEHIFSFEFMDDEFEDLQYFAIDG